LASQYLRFKADKPAKESHPLLSKVSGGGKRHDSNDPLVGALLDKTVIRNLWLRRQGLESSIESVSLDGLELDRVLSDASNIIQLTPQSTIDVATPG
jgi:hypothetical protein